MSSVKQVICLCLCLIVANPVFAEKCRHAKEKKDPFSEGVVMESSSFICSPDCFLELERSGENYYLKFKLRFGAMTDDVFTKDKVILMKLENGDQFNLSPDADAPPVVTGTSSIRSTYWHVRITVRKAQFEQISKSPLAYVKFTVGGKERLDKVRSSDGNKVMETAECMLAAH